MPPYNIMSTAAPRGEEEERSFTLQAATNQPEKKRFNVFFFHRWQSWWPAPPYKAQQVGTCYTWTDSTMRWKSGGEDRTCVAAGWWTTDNEVDDIEEEEEEQ